jgi:hypothetical protein
VIRRVGVVLGLAGVITVAPAMLAPILLAVGTDTLFLLAVGLIGYGVVGMALEPFRS